ncbi:GNAT family N-acetyltransferase [Marinobacter salarius]
MAIDNGQVSGLYESRYRLKGVLPIRSLQFVGTSSRELRTPRTEHNRFFKDMDGQPVIRGLEQQLESSHWSEAVFSDLRTGSEELSALVTLAATRRWGFRIIAADDGYAVTTSGDFEDYLGALGSNSRLRLYNRRTIFESLGEVRQENLWPTDPKDFFQALNRFHQARWKKDCVTDQSLAFHRAFLSRIEEEGGRPHLSALLCDDRLVSVLYNVWYQGVVYNIQAGFEENFHKKLSLGTLHLGYAIEDAFMQPDTHRFDLLAGKGKKEDYKARLATDSYQFLSVMLVKSALFRALYWMRGI